MCTCVIDGNSSNYIKQLLPIAWRNAVFEVYLCTCDLPDAENKSCKFSEFVADVIAVVIFDAIFFTQSSHTPLSWDPFQQ